MSIGTSGRVVIEIPPEIKRELHAALCRDGQTLKQWFMLRVEEYVQENKQLSIFDGKDVTN